MENKISNRAIDKLKYDLVREGLLDYNRLIDSIEQARHEQTNLGQVLIQNNIIREEELLNFLEKKLHIPYVNLEDYALDEKIIGLISEREARKYKLIPLFIIEETLTIAMADPLDLFALHNINISQNYKVEPVICSERSIIKLIDDLYKKDISSIIPYQTIESDHSKHSSKFNWQSELNEDKTDEVNIYRLVRALIYHAISEQATSIHLDPRKDEIAVRFRIDGILHSRGSLPILIANNCFSRIKSAAGISLNETSEPQTGRMEINIEKNTINTRINTFYTHLGEKIVIKIFYKTDNLQELGLETSQIAIFDTTFKKNKGMIIASGHPGNGQANTIYALMEKIDAESRNVMTIETSIIHNIDKVNQFEIGHQGLTRTLDDIVSQEPDVLYIDHKESINNVPQLIDLSLGSTLVFLKLNSTGVINTISELINSGIDINDIANSVNIIFSQQKLRLLCNKCKTSYVPNQEELHELYLTTEHTFYKADGCDDCNNTGFKGRITIYEILPFSAEFKKFIVKNQQLKQIEEYLISKDFLNMYDQALDKVKKGLVSIDEFKRNF